MVAKTLVSNGGFIKTKRPKNSPGVQYRSGVEQKKKRLDQMKQSQCHGEEKKKENRGVQEEEEAEEKKKQKVKMQTAKGFFQSREEKEKRKTEILRKRKVEGVSEGKREEAVPMFPRT